MLRQVIEKPDEATLARFGDAACLSMNCWKFTPAIFRACKSIEPSPRGEYELPDAVRYAMEQLGERFTAVVCDEPVLDLSYRDDITGVAQRLADVEVDL
jgi:glucose-1-phosphate thymidylyltransferase